MPAEAGIIEVDHMQSLIPDNEVVRMQVRVYQAERLGRAV